MNAGVSNEKTRAGIGDAPALAMRRALLALVIAWMVLLAGMSAPAVARTTGINASDRQLTRTLQDALSSQPGLRKVSGVVRHGVAYLTGGVNTAAQRVIAEQTARRATGLDTIYNGVQVGPYSLYG